MTHSFRLKCEPEGSPHHVIIEEEKGEKIECWAYQWSPARTAAVYAVGVMTCGLLFLVVFYWKPDWGLRLTHRRCPHQIADSLIIKDVFEMKHRVDILHQHVGKGTYNGDGISATTINAVTRRNLTLDGSSSLKYFRFEKSKYIWDSEQQLYFKLRGLSHYVSCSEIHGRYFKGLSQRETHQRQRMYGLNEIQVRVRPILVLLLKEVLNPFYVFQLYTIIFWFCINYIYYTVCIIIMSAISIAISLYTTRTESTKLRKMAKLEETVLVVRPDGSEEETSSLELVPGDVIRIPTNGCLMTCDAVLLAGNCVVNESMLTGESVPVTKTPLPNPRETQQVYSMDGHKRHTLFCGTHVIQTRAHGGEVAKCVVVQTGFSTAKGQLVKSILYVKPAEIKLYRDTLRFVGILAILSFIGFIYTAVIMLNFQGASVKKTMIHALDIITIAVPPALPAVLTIGMVYAQLRLKKQHIYCISPQRINLCGTVDVVCFDKTGTLTEDGLDLLGVRGVTKARFNPVTADVRSLPRDNRVPVAMATCHELMEVEGEITGDPLDLKMFDATGWTLDVGEKISSSSPGVISVAKRRTSDSAASTPYDDCETKEPFTKVATLKIFPFASALQTMGVVVRDESSGQTYGVVKGSPEKVSALSRKDTIPTDFQEVLDGYTRNGLRLLALAWKPMDISNDGIDDVNHLQRDSVECDMEFLGLMIMQNKLKPASAPAIHELNQANIRTVMVTGDNLNTAVSVGRECGIISRGSLVLRIEAEPPSASEAAKPKIVLTPLIEDTTETDRVVDLGVDDEMNPSAPLAAVQPREEERLLAMDGTTFGIIGKYYPHLMPKISAQGVVFARMSPDQKSQLVDSLQSLGLSVGMCGDGANDCGALKQAHVGIALSQAEASVAAPFTSKTPTISCIPTVIKEGRCALVTSSCLFKFMAMYSLIMFASVVVLTTVEYYVGDMQFFVFDIVLCTSFVLTVGGNKAHHEISTKRPHNKLVVPSVVFALIIQILLQLTVQISGMMLVRIQSWYESFELDPAERNVVSYENTTVFLLANFLYLNCAFVYTPGPPYSTRFYKNIPLTITFLCGLFVCIGFLFGPPDKVITAFEMIKIPTFTFKTILFGMAILHFGLAHLIEYLAQSDALMGVVTCRSCRKKPPATHQGIELQLLKKPLMELVTEISL